MLACVMRSLVAFVENIKDVQDSHCVDSKHKLGLALFSTANVALLLK